ncbi:MAG: hypothetical protein IJU50_09980 [Lachnospiraceae bacterium]|nr:hypothetical protein [Lachnospiraceae bacterium]
MQMIKCPQGHYYDGQAYSECPYCSMDDDDIKTVALNVPSPGEFQPVPPSPKGDEQDYPVGFLVRLDGEKRGEDLTLHAGANDVFSGKARILYNSDSHVFEIEPLGGREILRLEGRPVLERRLLADGSEIRMKEGKYRFVAVCDVNFYWKDSN